MMEEKKKREQHELLAGIKSNAATATAAINTHLFRSVLYTREAWAHQLVR